MFAAGTSFGMFAGGGGDDGGGARLATLDRLIDPPNPVPPQGLSGNLQLDDVGITGNIAAGPVEDTSHPQVSIGAVVTKTGKSPDGSSIAVIEPAWTAYIDALRKDPQALYVLDDQQWEEMLAAYYVKAGFAVELTPRSGDFGRDVIATMHGLVTVRILGQMRAKKAHRIVTAENVASLLHCLAVDPKATHAVFSTTARFAPKITTDPRIAPYLGGRLELMDGDALRARLLGLGVPPKS